LLQISKREKETGDECEIKKKRNVKDKRERNFSNKWEGMT